MTAIIDVADLTKTFTIRVKTGRFRKARKTVTAVDGVSMRLEAGEAVGYIGPNGAGKSTTLKMLTGILNPTSGHLRVCGLEPVPQRIRLTQRLGVVFGQRSALWWDLPLADSFDLLRHIFDVPRADHAARLAMCRRLLELDEFLQTPVRQLSLGQRMRGELTAALLHGPKVLFLDEPTIGLDVMSKQAVRQFLSDIGEAGDTTLILTTHDLADIERLCPRLIVIDHGTVVHDGSIGALHERYGAGREVIVDFDADWDPAASPVPNHGEFVDDNPRRVRFRVGEGDLSAGELVARIASAGGLRDVSIVEPDIESVVAKLYRAPSFDGAG